MKNSALLAATLLLALQACENAPKATVTEILPTQKPESEPAPPKERTAEIQHVHTYPPMSARPTGSVVPSSNVATEEPAKATFAEPLVPDNETETSRSNLRPNPGTAEAEHRSNGSVDTVRCRKPDCGWTDINLRDIVPEDNEHCTIWCCLGDYGACRQQMVPWVNKNTGKTDAMYDTRERKFIKVN